MRTMRDMRAELHLLGKALEKYVRISKDPHDFGVGEPLYPAEIHGLGVLCEQGPMSLTALADSLTVTKGAASQLVARLEDKGLVRKEPDPSNRSRLLLHATPLGDQAQEAHLRFHEEHDQEFLSRLGSLSPEEYGTFSRICTWMDQWMDNYLRRETGE